MMDRDYQAEDDCRTLERAHEVQSDSRRRAAARKFMGKKLQTMKRVHRSITGRR